jgi:hypothetical protein
MHRLGENTPLANIVLDLNVWTDLKSKNLTFGDFLDWPQSHR